MGIKHLIQHHFFKKDLLNKLLQNKFIKRCIILFIIFILLFVGGYIGIVLKNTKDKFNIPNYSVIDYIKDGLIYKYTVLKNYYNGLKAQPETIYINISDQNFQKLANKREIAIQEGKLVKSDDDYVPATVKYNDKIINIKIRSSSAIYFLKKMESLKKELLSIVVRYLFLL